jgi:hypothetical protein
MKLSLATAITTGYSSDAWLGVQVDPFGGDDAGEAAYQVVGTYGFLSRPLQPEGSEGALVLTGRDGHDGFAWIGHDPRDVERLPQLTEGSSAQYNARGAFAVLEYETETYTVYQPVEENAKAHCLTMGYDSNEKLFIGLMHALGFALLMTEDALVLKNKAGDSYIEINATGITLNGNTKLVGGTDIGGTGGQPVINATLFATWWAALASAVTAQGAAPLTGATLGAALQAATAGLAATGTTLLKGL